jgi:hypothetical protein
MRSGRKDLTATVRNFHDAADDLIRFQPLHPPNMRVDIVAIELNSSHHDVRSRSCALARLKAADGSYLRNYRASVDLASVH